MKPSDGVTTTIKGTLSRIKLGVAGNVEDVVTVQGLDKATLRRYRHVRVMGRSMVLSLAALYQNSSSRLEEGPKGSGTKSSILVRISTGSLQSGARAFLISHRWAVVLVRILRNLSI